MRFFAALACLASFVPSGAALAQEPVPGSAPAAPPAVAPSDATPPAPSAPATVLAAPSGVKPKVYLGVRAGMYNPSADDDDEITSLFDNGLDLEAIVGIPLSPNFAFEGGIGYYGAGTGQMSMFDPDLGTITAEMDLAVIPITASLRGTAYSGPVAFSALAGVGLHMASFDLTGSVPGVGSASISEDDNVFGFHIGAAVGVAVTERVRLGLELRRTFVSSDMTEEIFDQDITLDGLRLGATLTFTP
jgi:hypothetical protein